ncbi:MULTISPECIES: zf-HC2 domain-containing protein [unclassified Paenibacillus]|uniref:zf-HC2 domain-containing protein n=1 Tax=unclassified Paenibacillus TaxID=185978 RepID=UPI001AE89E18|nr:MULTISPECIES: zf-HC2 domain-containing protein [unclassified Paenibacillus]MBP1156369.1 cytoskeletal protein RodZ [Paenibacillus sp. PvP091]MBP1168245.1 cytoskeletal protein RodZ [Paenibacillus sp. PvR098]MBP2439273.1 cytoskeletal protein RodZ [Paenibacillus sp. PvP052]
MMCQEVIELMQRYLDRDLDETEYGRMLGHLQQCPDCTKLFERLVNLSHELESLPKVTPPFSLVDAIMPKLEQLEAGGQLSGTAWSSQTGEEGAARETEQRGAMSPAEQPKLGSKRKNVKEWFSFPVFGGVVAAGLVFGFFLFQQQSGPDAGSIWLGLNQQKASENAAQDSSSQAADNQADTMSIQEESASPASQDHLMDQKGAPAGGEAPKEAAAGDGQDEQRQTPAESQVPRAPAPKAAKPSASQDQPGAAARSEEPTVSRTETPEPEVPSGMVPPAAEAPAPSEEPSYGAASIMDPPANGGGGVPKEVPSEVAAPDHMRNKSGGHMGIMGMPEAEEPPMHQLASPDGKYTAYFENAHVTVRNKEGQEAYTSKYSWEDADRVDLVEWSTDNKLTYRVKMHEQSRTFVISVAELTEIETK